jgi:hypothetical protein
MTTLWTKSNVNRRYFIGGSDARIIMGNDERALAHLWREKRGEVEAEDLFGNLVVQLGVVTEPLNRHSYERNSRQTVKEVQRWVSRPPNQWIGAELINSGKPLVAMGADDSALLRLWMKKMRRGYFRLACRGFRSRRPSPPPFSPMNSIPAASIARCSFARASSETRGPNPPSSRLTVGRDSPARSASSD